MVKMIDEELDLNDLEERIRSGESLDVDQVGLLVVSTGADALDPYVLAGVLLDAVALSDERAREAWRAKGVLFFRRRASSGDNIEGIPKGSPS